jgi:catalase
VSSGFADSTYNSLDAFRFISAAGNSIPVRWSMVPVQQFVEAGSAQSWQQGKNYLFDALIRRINQPSQQPLQWHLIVTLGQPGDPTNNATLAWPDNREHVDVGTSGIAPFDDPLLSARSAAYSQSFTRRAGETKDPSAVTPAEILRQSR